MKNITKIGLAVFAAASIAPAAHAVQATGDTKATILSPLTVTKTATLEFGKIVAGTTDSSVSMAADGTFTCGTGLTCLGSHSEGGFTVTGVAGESVTVSADSSAVLSNGTNSMTTTLNASANTLTLTGGTAPFSVGGTLTVLANQAAGAYAGSYNVTVSYQ